MAELQTISKTVNEIPIDDLVNNHTDPVALYHVTDETTSSTNDIEASRKTDVINTQDEEINMATLNSKSEKEPPNNGKVTDDKQEEEILLNLKKVTKPANAFRKSILKKNHSDPSFLRNPSFKDINLKNIVCETTLLDNSVKHRQSFADIVTEVITGSIKGDLHPYGRGHLYHSAIYGDEYQAKTFRNDEKLLLWAVATLLILGITCGIILMSIMYQRSELIDAHKSDVNTTNIVNTTAIFE